MNNINRISPDEQEWLHRISGIAKPPKSLWYIGNLPSPRPTVAIVGSRKPTAYGREIALRLARELAARGVVVVSGLALGIDGLAHQGALEAYDDSRTAEGFAKGVTVAILGTPINYIYPRSHFALAREIIAKGGAIISEIGPNEKYYPATSFLARNRLISALADVVIVVEANEKSGSLNTAGHAIEQARELFAVPGNITSPMSVGCNRLIAQGAAPLLNVDDILEKLGLIDLHARKRSRKSAGDTPNEKLIFNLIREGVGDGDELISRSHLPASEVSLALTMLEISGAIRPLGCNVWAVK